MINTFSKYQKIVDFESIKNIITQRQMYKTTLHIVYKRLKKRSWALAIEVLKEVQGVPKMWYVCSKGHYGRQVNSFKKFLKLFDEH